MASLLLALYDPSTPAVDGGYWVRRHPDIPKRLLDRLYYEIVRHQIPDDPSTIGADDLTAGVALFSRDEILLYRIFAGGRDSHGRPGRFLVVAAWPEKPGIPKHLVDALSAAQLIELGTTLPGASSANATLEIHCDCGPLEVATSCRAVEHRSWEGESATDKSHAWLIAGHDFPRAIHLERKGPALSIRGLTEFEKLQPNDNESFDLPRVENRRPEKTISRSWLFTLWIVVGTAVMGIFLAIYFGRLDALSWFGSSTPLIKDAGPKRQVRQKSPKIPKIKPRNADVGD